MRRLFLCLSLFICLNSLAQPTWLLHQSFAKKFYYADSLYRAFTISNEKELISQLGTLIDWANEKGDRELGDAITITLYRRIPAPKDFEEIITEKYQNALENKRIFSQVEYLELLGNYTWGESRKHARSFEYYLTAYGLFSDKSPEEFPAKRKYLYVIGNAYYSYDDFDNAIRYLREAEQTKPAFKDEFTHAIYNSLGLCYRYKKKYDSSEWCFRQIFEHGDKEIKSIAAGNIGINYYYQNRYDEAIPLLQMDIDTSLRRRNDLRNAANSLYILSMIQVSRHEYDKAEEHLLTALQICRDKTFWPDYQLEDHIFTQLHKVYTAKNDLRKANLYADSAMAAKDSLRILYDKLNVAKAQEKNEYIQHKLDMEQLVGQKQMHRLIRNSLLAGTLLLLIIGLLFINRQMIRQKKVEAEKKVTEFDLANAVEKLESFKQSVQEKNQLIEHFNSEIERIRVTEEEHTDNELRSQLQQATILTDEQWEDFRQLFEQVHKGFFGGLKKKFPDLTQAEIRFLALSKMKLTSKEMASMLGISVNAIRMNRHRLRRKLDLDKDELIETLVDDI